MIQRNALASWTRLHADVEVILFGDDAGVGARSAVGVGSLPGNIAVEIECIFEVADK